MKKNNKWLRIAAGMAALLLTICGSYPAFAAEDASYTEYNGYLFSGKDPWDGTLTIMVRSITDGKMDWTFTDSFEDHTLFQIVEGTVLQNGQAEFDIEGKDAQQEGTSFSYYGELELKDGKLAIAFQSGSVTDESSEGGSSYHTAEALSDSGISNRVVLDKTADGPYTEYTVKAGDSIHSIASEHGISTKDLAILNQAVIMETAKSHGLEFEDVTEYTKHLYPGEILLVPENHE